MDFFKKMSLIPRGLRYKLLIAFTLMSVIPLLVSLYIVRDYLFPPRGDIISVSWILFFCMLITFLGLLIAKQIVEPVVEMAVETRLIADGNIDHQVHVRTEDEIGDLARSINDITLNIREKIEELKSYGEKTKLINAEIHKKVLALSGLLQIGENISCFAELKNIMGLIADKAAHIVDSGYALLFFPKPNDPAALEISAFSGFESDNLHALEIKIGNGFLGTAVLSNLPVYSNAKTKTSRQMQDFMEENNIKNFVTIPVISRKKAVGMLLVGSESENFEFKEDDIEVFKIFTKQAAIAYESSALTKKAKELEIRDDLTDLYNEKYIAERMGEEIKRAMLYQRPCSYIVFDIDDFDKFRVCNGELAVEKALKKVASILNRYTSEIGRAARLSGDSFALLLPEKNKREAYKIAEDIRMEVEKIEMEGANIKHLTVSGGVSENPIDGMSAADLMEKAAAGVSAAKTQGKNRII